MERRYLKMNHNQSQTGEFEITTIVLDLNGTLAVQGRIVEGAKERIKILSDLGIRVILLTADRRGNAKEMCEALGIELFKANSSEEKADLFRQLDAEKTVSIGNARIDIGMFKYAKLSIATLQAEGIHTGILEHVDIIVPSINNALDLFIDRNSLNATMQE